MKNVFMMNITISFLSYSRYTLVLHTVKIMNSFTFIFIVTLRLYIHEINTITVQQDTDK